MRSRKCNTTVAHTRWDELYNDEYEVKAQFLGF